jgi:hypothetical protein
MKNKAVERYVNISELFLLSRPLATLTIIDLSFFALYLTAIKATG